jgi:hypothetical protein
MRRVDAFIIGLATSVLGQPLHAAGFEVRGLVPTSLPADTTVPVAVPIPEDASAAKTLKARLSVGDSAGVDVVLQPEGADSVSGTPARAWFAFKTSEARAGKPVVLQVVAQDAPATKDAYAVRRNDVLVDVTTPEGKLVLSYRHGKPDPAYKYPMTSYIHPLMGLDGEVLTDCSPKDHLHHRGLFWAWVRLDQNGTSIGDWWIPRDIVLQSHGLSTAAGPVFAAFSSQHYYLYQPAAPAKQPVKIKPGERVMDEQVVCRVFETTDAGRAIDVDLTLTALVDGLQIGGQTQLNKGYGGLTLRFGADPTHSGKTRLPKIVADGKVIEKDLNHLVASWVDWTGLFDGPDGKVLGQRSGGAVFVHPSHPPLPTSPPEWIARTYGPINVAYPGLDMLDIPRDKPLRLRYRVWIHRGEAEQAGVDGQYRAYAADWKWSR